MDGCGFWDFNWPRFRGLGFMDPGLGLGLLGVVSPKTLNPKRETLMRLRSSGRRPHSSHLTGRGGIVAGEMCPRPLRAPPC